jgi:hypothetical protein
VQYYHFLKFKIPNRTQARNKTFHTASTLPLRNVVKITYFCLYMAMIWEQCGEAHRISTRLFQAHINVGDRTYMIESVRAASSRYKPWTTEWMFDTALGARPAIRNGIRDAAE